MRVRSPLLAQSLICFLLLQVLRCFSSLGLLLDCSRFHAFSMKGCPIRKSADQRIFAPPRSLSQLITSFFASESLGIPHTPFVTSFFHAFRVANDIPHFTSDSFESKITRIFSYVLARCKMLPIIFTFEKTMKNTHYLLFFSIFHKHSNHLLYLRFTTLSSACQ